MSAIIAASTAAGANGLLYFPAGTYGTSIPLSPQYPGQTWLGAGRTSDEPGATWTPATSAVVAGMQDQETEESDPDDDCIGPDDPGVGPWMYDFYD